ncbi:hypothetical protein A0O36_00249 [Piscirickettsiaceae bacterium NZ-RLO1]|nr:hypothetical protein A0O36_00249 [Piscirickettsiaceae bacterium NZ-RLO1]
MPNIKIPEQDRIQRMCDKLNRLASVAVSVATSVGILHIQ